MNELRYLILFNEVEHPVVLGAMHLHEPRPWIVLFFQAQQRIPSGTLCFRFVLAPVLDVGPQLIRVVVPRALASVLLPAAVQELGRASVRERVFHYWY